MRLLTALSLACGALALATGPVQSLTDSLTVDDGDSPINLQNAAVVQEITRRDEKVSSSELEKREGFYLQDLWLPDEPYPKNVIYAGVTISFIMGVRYVMQQGKRIKQYYTQTMHFQYDGKQRVAVQAMAAGQKFFYSHLNNLESGSANPDPKASTYSLAITPIKDEL
ncbi:hypothetical protein E4U58_001296 [Claviceps cyperi]|nr:hypothetical protein E4U58_001296 [Claviceps cyperi]